MLKIGNYSVDHKTHNLAEIHFPDGGIVRVKTLLADGDQNPKTEKNTVETRGFSMAPHKAAGIGNVCSHATLCVKGCLHEISGQRLNSKTRARIARTVLWFADRVWFLAKLNRELAAFRASVPAGLPCGVRLNMFSDIPWERFGIPQNHPGITFYDYTKNPNRFRTASGSWILPNYHLTFSYDGTADSLIFARKRLADGGNVSAVFHEVKPGVCNRGAVNQTLPQTWEGFPVFDGSETDWRPDDAPGTVCGLVLRARSYAERSRAIDPGFSAEVKPGEVHHTAVPVLA